MALKADPGTRCIPISDLEHLKFGKDVDDCIYVRVQTINGAVAAIQNEGQHKEVDVTDSGWTELTTGLLTGPNRLAINVQNNTVQEMKVSHGAATPTSGYVGVTIPANGGERQYAISENIKLWGRLKAGGTLKIDVEELR